MRQSTGHERDFLDCVRERRGKPKATTYRQPYFPAEIGHRCASLLHIGNIAMRLGRPLRWDPKREAFVDDAEANGMRSRAMRQPWHV